MRTWAPRERVLTVGWEGPPYTLAEQVEAVALLVEGEKELLLLPGPVVPKVGTSLPALLLNLVSGSVIPQ